MCECYLLYIYAQLTQLQVRHAAEASSCAPTLVYIHTYIYPAFIIITSPENLPPKKQKKKNEQTLKKKGRKNPWWWWTLMNALGFYRRNSAALVNVLICLWQLLSPLEKLNVKYPPHIKHQLFMPDEKGFYSMGLTSTLQYNKHFLFTSRYANTQTSKCA